MYNPVPRFPVTLDPRKDYQRELEELEEQKEPLRAKSGF